MKNENEVDWSKAPEGATHYNECCTCPWLKDSPASYFRDGWVEYCSSGDYKDHFINAVKRPQEMKNEEMENKEWSGMSLPPVGTRCEYFWAEGDEWRKCEVVAYHLSRVVAVDTSDGSAVCQRVGLFRPIKTPEQIAEEERLQAIDEMLGLVDCHSTFGDVMGALYDAGYRKTES